jgi:glycosyltransferase involved in cell wall biosynthesis
MSESRSGAVTQRPPRILFISHDASRTGAPILLLHLVRWLKNTAGLSFEIVLRSGGPLVQEFSDVAPTAVWNRVPTTLIDSVTGIGRRRRLARRYQHIDLIYSNTVTNGTLIRDLCNVIGSRPVITHAHELEVAIRSFGPQNMGHVIDQTTRFVACAHAVKANLVANHAASPSVIDVVHEFIQPSGVAPDPADRAEVRREWGIPLDAVVIGAAGTMDWRKFPEGLVLLARRVIDRCADEIHFVWVGGDGAGTMRQNELQHEVQGLGVSGRVHFPGSTTRPQRAFSAFDAFALTSREDPFPLVCLEAAALGLPILCFDGAGGEPEFVEDDAGFVVPYLDIDAMAEAVVQLASDAGLRRRLGDNAQRKVRERHLVDHAGSRILRILESVLRSSNCPVALPSVIGPATEGV